MSDNSKSASNKKKPESDASPAVNGKKKLESDASSSTKGSSMPARFCKRMKDLMKAAGEVEQEARAMAEYERMVVEMTSLKKEVETKTAEAEGLREAKSKEVAQLRREIEHLEQAKRHVRAEFDEQLTELKAKVASSQVLEDVISKLEDDLVSAAESSKQQAEKAKRLGKELKAEKLMLREKERALAIADSKTAELSIVHQKQDAELRRLRIIAAEEQIKEANLGDAKSRLEEFAARCHALIFANVGRWDEAMFRVDELREAYPQLPLSKYKTKSAQLMRTAAVEAVVGRVLVKHIFVDVYTTEPHTMRRAIAETLEHMREDPQRQLVTRCQLLGAFVLDEGLRQHATENAVSEVIAALTLGLSSVDQCQDFFSRLRQLFIDGVNIWQPLQRHLDRVIASMSPTLEWLDVEDQQPDYGPPCASGHAEPGYTDTTGLKIGGFGILPLFPQISIPNASEDVLPDGILFHGFALWSSQQYVAEAREELETRVNSRDSRIGDQKKSALGKRRCSIASPTIGPPNFRIGAGFKSPVSGGTHQASANGGHTANVPKGSSH